MKRWTAKEDRDAALAKALGIKDKHAARLLDRTPLAVRLRRRARYTNRDACDGLAMRPRAPQPPAQGRIVAG